MARAVRIAPSILSADFARLGEEVRAVDASGADVISIHPEAGPHPHRTLQFIRSLGKKAGYVLNPGTPVEMLDPLFDMIDLIVIMTVNPGFGGQAFLSSQLI